MASDRPGQREGEDLGRVPAAPGSREPGSQAIPAFGFDPSRDAAAYVVVDFRKEWLRQPYLTFWGPESKGYFWSLPQAGRYTAAELDASVGYHTNRRYVVSRGARVGSWERFGVPAAVLEALASPPDAEGRWRLAAYGGPIVRNSAALRKKLVALRYVPTPRAPDPSAEQPEIQR